jgi:hypothetical protein
MTAVVDERIARVFLGIAATAVVVAVGRRDLEGGRNLPCRI